MIEFRPTRKRIKLINERYTPDTTLEARRYPERLIYTTQPRTRSAFQRTHVRTHVDKNGNKVCAFPRIICGKVRAKYFVFGLRDSIKKSQIGNDTMYRCMFTLSLMLVVSTYKEICVSQHVSV